MKKEYIDIINSLISVEKNNVFSPTAFADALFLLSKITAGNTRKQIVNLTGEKRIILHETLENCKVSSSCWINSYFAGDAGLADMDSLYRVKMGEVKTDKMIKEWVSQATEEMLDDEIDISTDRDTVVELLSAIYFKAAWNRKFNKKDSYKGEFHITEDKISECEFMSREIRTPYYCGEGYDAVGIGFSSCANMWFVRPRNGRSIKESMNEFISSNYNSKWEEHMVMLAVPKADISSKLDLRDCMIRLGIEEVFDGNKADFSALSETERLCLTKAEQTSRIKWDEDGVEGASCVEMAISRACIIPESDRIEFILDSPFFYMITDFDDNPLFAGVFLNN